jgi:hypothetical protein
MATKANLKMLAQMAPFSANFLPTDRDTVDSALSQWMNATMRDYPKNDVELTLALNEWVKLWPEIQVKS